MRVMENLTAGIAVALAISVAEGRAAPFEAVSDAPDRVWVVDSGTGELTLCRLYAAAGPKVIDVFGGESEVREAAQRNPEPYCEVVRSAEAYRGGYARQNYTGYTMYEPLSGISTGYWPDGVLPGGGYLSGGFPYNFGRWGDSQGDVVVVRPNYVNINVD
jgi:hypothetical protein